jgi:hypothetical protein
MASFSDDGGRDSPRFSARAAFEAGEDDMPDITDRGPPSSSLGNSQGRMDDASIVYDNIIARSEDTRSSTGVEVAASVDALLPVIPDRGSPSPDLVHSWADSDVDSMDQVFLAEVPGRQSGDPRMGLGWNSSSMSKMLSSFRISAGDTSVIEAVQELDVDYVCLPVVLKALPMFSLFWEFDPKPLRSNHIEQETHKDFTVCIATSPARLYITKEYREKYVVAFNTLQHSFHNISDTDKFATKCGYRAFVGTIQKALEACGVTDVLVEAYGFKAIASDFFPYLDLTQKVREETMASTESVMVACPDIVLDVSRSVDPPATEQESTITVFNVCSPGVRNGGVFVEDKGLLRQRRMGRCGSLSWQLFPMFGTLGNWQAGGYKAVVQDKSYPWVLSATLYPRIRHWHLANTKALYSGRDLPTTVRGAKTVAETTSSLVSQLSNLPRAAGGYRIEVRIKTGGSDGVPTPGAIVACMGDMFSVPGLEQFLAKCAKQPLVITPHVLSVDSVVEQAAVFHAAFDEYYSKLGRNSMVKLDVVGQALLLICASSIGYSDALWSRTLMLLMDNPQNAPFFEEVNNMVFPGWDSAVPVSSVAKQVSIDKYGTISVKQGPLLHLEDWMSSNKGVVEDMLLNLRWDVTLSLDGDARYSLRSIHRKMVAGKCFSREEAIARAVAHFPGIVSGKPWRHFLDCAQNPQALPAFSEESAKLLSKVREIMESAYWEIGQSSCNAKKRGLALSLVPVTTWRIRNIKTFQLSAIDIYTRKEAVLRAISAWKVDVLSWHSWICTVKVERNQLGRSSSTRASIEERV